MSTKELAYDVPRPVQPLYNHVAQGQIFNMTLDDVIAWQYDLGLDTYPIWDESKRRDLNNLIINHFRFREIRGETPARFIYYLNKALIDGMGPINVMFEALEDTYLEEMRVNINLDATGAQNSTNDTTADSSSTSHAYASTNPRQTMVDKDPTEYYDSGTYSTTGTGQTAHNTGDSETTTHTGGYSGSDFVDTLNRFITGVNNPLYLVYSICEDAFCQVWSDHYNVFNRR